MKNRHFLLEVLLLVFSVSAFAQNKIGDNPTVIHAGSLLELESSTKGFRLPRIPLNDLHVWTLDGTATSGMLVFNETGTAPKGMYYWNTDLSQWVQILNFMPNQVSFFDASTSFNSTVNKGKGLVFPQTDLTTFTFITDALNGTTFPSAFDGMIVYNVGTGQTIAGQGVQADVKPGFYYFSNPTGVTTKMVVAGKWIRIIEGSDATTANGTAYYGVLNTTAPTSTEILTLNNKSLASGSYSGNFDQSLASAGYFTVAIPVSWRNPSLKIDGNDTWNVFNAASIVSINNINYQIWQTDVPLLSGKSVVIK